MDREKVVEILELCTSDAPIDRCLDNHCPYFGGDGERTCFDYLMKDALELLKAQEPVVPVFERQFMSNIELYDCGKCGTSLGAKGIAKYCMKCGRAVKWDG